MFSSPSFGPMVCSLAIEMPGRERSAAQQQRGLARLVIDRPVVRKRLLKSPGWSRR